MANGIAVGGFAQGLSQGLNQGVGLVSQLDKNRREEEMFKLQKEKGELELAEMKKNQEYQAELAAAYKALIAQRQGGTVGGEAVDEFGTPIGKVQYSDPAAAKASGLQFKQGTTVEAKPMDDVEFTGRMADAFMTTGYKYGKVNLEQIEKANEFNKKMDTEGLNTAVRTWLTTRDKDATVKEFNRRGKMKLDPNSVDIETVQDPTGMTPANVIVYELGPDGKRGRQILNYQEVRLAGLSNEAYSQIVAGGRKSKFEQGEANKRTGMEVAGRIDAALIGARGDSNKKDPVKDRIDKLVFDFSGKLTSNPAISYNVDEFRRQTPQIAARAYQYMTGRVPGQTVRFDDEALAVDQATQDILGKPKK